MGNEVDRHLGRRLWQRRRSLGLTQQQLAEAIGVAFQQIQKYECGRSRLSASRLWSVCNALHVDVSYFFDGLDRGACSSTVRARKDVA
jgi:transcriptional regulator with XRE-family HTH domain